MTAIEKKKILNKIIDALPEENLDEAIFLVEGLALKDENRINFVKKLLEREKALFKRLAE